MNILEEEMTLRGFSQRTIKTYSYHIRDFLAFCREYSPEKKKEYLLHLLDRKIEPASVRLASAAIDFYIRTTLKQEPLIVSLPKRKKQLPEVLTKEQIKAMINSTTNIKHQLIIELLYSTGMRLSELLKLRVEDIDFEHNTVRIVQGKGAKDRITIISKNTAQNIKNKIISGRILSGRKGSYSQKSVQLVIENSARKAGIQQNTTPHILRHSFAIHLLESGVDIRYIQSLLGHEQLRTTQIYTRVAKNKLEQIKNPLDN